MKRMTVQLVDNAGVPRKFVEIEADVVKAFLIATGGDITRAALALGLAKVTVYKKIRDYRIDIDKIRKAAS